MPLRLPMPAANFKRSVGDVNAMEQPYKYNTLATTPTPTATATTATPVYNSNNINSNTLPNSKTNGFAAAAAAAPVAAHIDKAGGQPVPAPRRTNSVPGDGGAYNGAASTSGSSGDSASDAQVRTSVSVRERQY